MEVLEPLVPTTFTEKVFAGAEEEVKMVSPTEPDPPSLTVTHGGLGKDVNPMNDEDGVMVRQTVPEKPPKLIVILVVPVEPGGMFRGVVGPVITNLTTVTVTFAFMLRLL